MLVEGLPRFRPGAAWLSPLEVINAMRRFATSNDAHAFLTDLSGDSPARLLGKPLHEASDIDGTIPATADNRVLAVGDFTEGYIIADRIGPTIEVVPHVLGANGRPTGERGYLLWWRVGADVVVDNALRLFNVT